MPQLIRAQTPSFSGYISQGGVAAGEGAGRESCDQVVCESRRVGSQQNHLRPTRTYAMGVGGCRT